MLIPLFRPSFSNYFPCVLSIMLVILIYFFLLSQIGMAQPAYARPSRCHLGTTYMFDYFVRGCVTYLVSLATSFPEYRPDFLYYFRPKAALYSGVFVVVLILSNVPSATIHSIVPHGKWVQLVHIHLHQVPFIISQPGRHVINEKCLSFDIWMSFLSWLNALRLPCMSLLGLLLGTNTTSPCS